MAKIANVVSALKTFLEGLTWTSDDGSGSTKFNAVFTAPNYVNDDGSPFVVIDDSTASGQFETIKTYRLDTQISVEICVNYADMENATDEDGKREEAMLRIREAWDYVKTQLYKVTTWRDTLGVDIGFTPGYTDRFEPDNNLLVRQITLTVTELIRG
jgi:hypothetical protein